MPKCGILHDYDLWANREPSSQSQTCAVCGASPMRFQWSDLSYEAMCTQCGCAYQLNGGSKERETEGKYPYLNIKPDFLPIAQEYWNQTQCFVCYGRMMGPQPGMEEFMNWLEIHHPEHVTRTENTV